MCDNGCPFWDNYAFGMGRCVKKAKEACPADEDYCSICGEELDDFGSCPTCSGEHNEA